MDTVYLGSVCFICQVRSPVEESDQIGIFFVVVRANPYSLVPKA